MWGEHMIKWRCVWAKMGICDAGKLYGLTSNESPGSLRTNELVVWCGVSQPFWCHWPPVANDNSPLPPIIPNWVFNILRHKIYLIEAGEHGQTWSPYTRSTPRRSLDKCASKKRNIEEMRQNIKVSNHSASKLVQNLAVTNQSHCLLSIWYGDHAELPNRNLRNPLEGHARLSPRNHPQLLATQINYRGAVVEVLK